MLAPPRIVRRLLPYMVRIIRYLRRLVKNDFSKVGESFRRGLGGPLSAAPEVPAKRRRAAFAARHRTERGAGAVSFRRESGLPPAAAAGWGQADGGFAKGADPLRGGGAPVETA
jgi:hypothetical protein